MTPKELATLLKTFGLKLDKSLGQHFLIDESVRDALVSHAGVVEGEKILEVGPGIGFISKALLDDGAELFSVEVDDSMSNFLELQYHSYDTFHLIREDILQVSTSDLMQGGGEEIEGDLGRAIGNYRVVANIPYYLTGKLIPFFLENILKPRELYLVIQKEVAERLVSADGKSSVPSIALDLFATAEILEIAPPEAFYPPPAVDSALLKIVVKDSIVPVDQKLFFKVVKASFRNKRKQLHNSLASTFHLEKEVVMHWLSVSDVNPSIRAEQLQLDDFIRLTDTFPSK